MVADRTQKKAKPGTKPKLNNYPALQFQPLTAVESETSQSGIF